MSTDPAVDPGATADESTADTTNDTGGTTASTDATGATEATGSTGNGADEGFAALGPPTGEPIVIGMVNTEGTPVLDFPEMRTDTDLAVDYLNQHGGMGDRPIVIEHCASNGSPEMSQACAQELAGKGVEFVMLGLDLFPGYDTFAASGIPVFGALPVLPGDYSTDALFLTGGNATTMAAMVALAVEHFEASSVGIISADNPASNGSEAALTGALDKAGVSYVSVKGGDNETDAGFLGLVREADADGPDLLVSLYADAGCIGAMRGRVALGIDTPVVSTAICGSAEVIDVVGDDAVGWSFVGVGAPARHARGAAFAELTEPAYGELSTTSLGVGGARHHPGDDARTCRKRRRRCRWRRDRTGDLRPPRASTDLHELPERQHARRAASRPRIPACAASSSRLASTSPAVRSRRFPASKRCRLSTTSPDRAGTRARTADQPGEVRGHDRLPLLPAARHRAPVRSSRRFGLGLLITHQGSGVVNFAFGAIGDVVGLRLRRSASWRLHVSDPRPSRALPLRRRRRLLAGDACWPSPPRRCSVSLVHLLVFRPLSRAPALANVVASIGLVIVIISLIDRRFEDNAGLRVDPILPREPVTRHRRRHRAARRPVAGRRRRRHRRVGLGDIPRFTRLGLVIRAAAENEKGAVLLGYSPTLLAAASFVFASAVGALRRRSSRRR